MTPAANMVQWAGWRLEDRLLVAPRKVRLTPAEARMMTALMTYRITAGRMGQSTKEKQNPHISPGELCYYSQLPTLSTMRTVVSTLRNAIGRESLIVVRDQGYLLLPANERHGTTIDPVDDLVTKLADALAAAKRVQKSRKEGLV